jgi:hypothetical protein
MSQGYDEENRKIMRAIKIKEENKIVQLNMTKTGYILIRMRYRSRFL